MLVGPIIDVVLRGL
jgi:hypothetical protein